MKKAIILLMMVLVLVSFASAATRYVNQSSASCSDGGTGLQGTPYCTIGAGYNDLVSGDILNIVEGWYNEKIDDFSSAFTSTVIMQGYENDNVNVSWVYWDYANASQRKGCWHNISDSTHNFWQTNCTGTNLDGASLMYKNDELIFRWANRNSWNSTYNYNGYWADESNNIGYLQLNDLSENPYDNPIYIHQDDDYCIRFDDVENLVIRNIQTNYCYYGMQFRNSSAILIENNTVNGGRYGIYIDDTTNEALWNFTIRNNEIRNYIDEINWIWTTIKGANADETMENHAILIEETEGNHSIYNNNVHGWFDGIYPISSNSGRRNQNTEIYNNTIYDILDDAIEVDDFQSNFHIYNNTIYDTYIGISIAGGNCTGLCTFDYNLIVANKSINYDGTFKEGECFKMGRTSYYVWNWLIDHNTCYSERYGIVGISGHYMFDTNFTNNIFYVEDDDVSQRSGYWNDGTFYDYNLYWRNSGNPLFDYWNGTGDYNSLASALASVDANGLVDINSLEVNPLLDSDFRPLDTSLACGAGEGGSDMGALDCDCVVPTEDLTITTDTKLCKGTYTLNDTNTNGAIIIGANDVTLDCNGATLIGNLSTTSKGIYAINRNNWEIKNCIIQGYNFGIQHQNSQDGKIYNNNLTSNTFNIYESWSIRPNITYNIISNSNYGIYFDYSTLLSRGDGNINNNLFNNISLQDMVIQGNNQSIFNNVFTDNLSSQNDISLNKLENSTFYNNNLSNTTLLLDTSRSLNIFNNSIYDSTYTIILTNTSSTNIYSNNIVDNIFTGGSHGILINEDSYNNTIYDNNVFNYDFGLLFEWRSYQNIAYSNNITSIIGIYDLHDTFNNTAYNNIINASSNAIKILDNISDSNYYNNTIINGNIRLENITINNSFINNIFTTNINTYVMFWDTNIFSVNETSTTKHDITLNNSGSILFDYNGRKDFTVTNNTIIIVNMVAPNNDILNVTSGKILANNQATYNVTIAPNHEIQVGDFIPQSISSVSAVTTNSSINITITYTIASNTTLTVGIGSSYTNIGTFVNTTFLVSPTINITGLTQDTTYNFNITEFCDSSANCNSTGFTFSVATDASPPTPSTITGRTNAILRGGVAVLLALAILAVFALPLMTGSSISVGLMITFLLITIIGMIAIQFVFQLT